MEPVHHALRVAEARGLEAPVAVAGLPGVVDHENARRDAVVEHGLRVLEDVLLVLVVGELDPGVDLRRAEEERIGHPAARGEPLAHRVAVGFREGGAGLLDDDVGGGLDGDRAVLQREERLGVRPDDAPLVRDEEGRALVVVVVPPQVDAQLGLLRERHLRAEEVRRAPPVLAGVHLDGRRAREKRERKKRRRCQKSFLHSLTCGNHPIHKRNVCWYCISSRLPCNPHRYEKDLKMTELVYPIACQVVNAQQTHSTYPNRKEVGRRLSSLGPSARSLRSVRQSQGGQPLRRLPMALLGRHTLCSAYPSESQTSQPSK